MRLHITSNPCGDIYPIAKSSCPLQLHLRNYNNQFVGPPSALPPYSYLRVVEGHRVPSEMLEELKGDFSEHLMMKNESVDKLVSALQARCSCCRSKLHSFTVHTFNTESQPDLCWPAHASIPLIKSTSNSRLDAILNEEPRISILIYLFQSHTFLQYNLASP